jgi:hypothetical protein
MKQFTCKREWANKDRVRSLAFMFTDVRLFAQLLVILDAGMDYDADAYNVPYYWMDCKSKPE